MCLGRSVSELAATEPFVQGRSLPYQCLNNLPQLRIEDVESIMERRLGVISDPLADLEKWVAKRCGKPEVAGGEIVAHDDLVNLNAKLTWEFANMKVFASGFLWWILFVVTHGSDGLSW